MLAVRAFRFTGTIAQGQCMVHGLAMVAIENTSTPGPGGIIEVFYADNGKPCFARDIWEHCLKLREPHGGGAWAPK